MQGVRVCLNAAYEAHARSLSASRQEQVGASMTDFVFGAQDGTPGSDLAHATPGSVQRMLRIAKANGWGEVAWDCRRELRRRSGGEETV